MTHLRLHQVAKNIDALELPIEPFTPAPGPGEVVVEIRAAGVNPSDVKAALGAMPHAHWPRTPGRDWAGIVTHGPAALLGREVWGSGGDLGISRDGSHATHLVLPEGAVCLKPDGISLAEAGAAGVPFVTAYQGFALAGMPKPGDVVLVLGANGKVGQAAIQLAAMHGARVFGANRDSAAYQGFASAAPRIINAAAEDIATVVRDETGGHGADIVYNTVGSPFFEAGNKSMALRGRQIFIATIERAVPFDIFAFYRGQHRFVGVDTLALNATTNAEIFSALSPAFAAGTLKPFPILPHAIFDLARAKEAYRAVIGGARDRIVLQP